MITVLGAKGFIGSHLVRQLRADGVSYFAPDRGGSLTGKNLGHVIYCIGLTADFRIRPFEAVDAHVCELLRTVGQSQFDSFTFLSSTRLYKRHLHTPARELDDLLLNPTDEDDLYGLSKALGEEIVLVCCKTPRVVRLSNVYGDDFGRQTFLSMIIREALTSGTITLETSLESAKDYVSIKDVVALLTEIALKGTKRIYNVASGRNTTNADLMKEIAEVTKCEVKVAANAPTVIFPAIDISRVREDFSFGSANILDDLASLVDSYRRTLELKL